MSVLRTYAYALTLVSVLAGPAAAQDPRGSISGRIVDSSGARLPGGGVLLVPRRLRGHGHQP